MQAALRARASGLAHQPFESTALDTFIGAVDGLDAVRLPTALAAWDCRNNRLAELGLAQDGFAEAVRAAVARLGAARIGVFLGTSTSGIHQTELAYRRRDAASGALPADFDYARTHNTYSVSGYVRARLGLAGPAWTVSTACSSSAKVFGTAARMIDAGLIDAAVVGGVDSLCLTTLYGFNSLELLAHEACRPWDRARTGLSIGEAAAFALLERPTASPASDAVLLLGVGESSDAHHMSSPHPEGLGARLAMQAALQAAALQPGDIDYLNLHGTATPSNDAAEDRAVVGLFGRSAPCSSTKGATGHTLGAAGALEAVVAALALREGFIPGGAQTSELDPALGANYVLQSRDAPLGRVLSNSFGFGGTNCSLVLGRA
jgi:3-oxoacyl-[acyl-carrier-protein] synthase-1